MTGETRDTVLAYTGYDHSDHCITFLGQLEEYRTLEDILFIICK